MRTPFIHLTIKTPIFQTQGGAGVGAIGGTGFASLVTSLKAAKVFRTRLKESVSDLLLLNIMSFISENSIEEACKSYPSLVNLLLSVHKCFHLNIWSNNNKGREFQQIEGIILGRITKYIP